MRSWNNVTLDQITPRVVTPLSYKEERSENWRRFPYAIPPLVMVAAMLICSPTSQLQPNISGNASVVSVPTTIAVERAHQPRPAFLNQFSKFFKQDFALEHETQLKKILLIGSANDVRGNSAGVADAIASFHDEEEWQPILS